MAPRPGENFDFNLLPPPSEREVEIVEERDDSVLYSMLLVFVAGLAFFGVTVANSILVEPRLVSFTSAVAERETQIETYEGIKRTHGELYIKTVTLKPVLEVKINPTEIFRVADEIAAAPGIAIAGYGRERSGVLVFEVTSATYEDIPELIRSTKEISGVSNVFVRDSRQRTSSNKIVSTISLSLIDGA